MNFKLRDAKRLMGLEVRQDGFQTVYFPREVGCGSFHEIEANVNLLVQLKDRLETF